MIRIISSLQVFTNFVSNFCPVFVQCCLISIFEVIQVLFITKNLPNKPNKFDIDETILLLDADSACLKILQSFIYLCPSKFEIKYWAMFQNFDHNIHLPNLTLIENYW